MKLQSKKHTRPSVEALWRVAETNDTDAVVSILAKGIDVNATNDLGVTALMRAVSLGRVRMVRALLEHGADPNIARKDRFTALLLAAFFGQGEIVKILVAHGADTSAVTRFETSAQMWAASRTFDTVVEYLDRTELSRQPERTSSVPINSVANQPELTYPNRDVNSWWRRTPSAWNKVITVAASIVIFSLIGLVTDYVLQPETPRIQIPLPQQQNEVAAPLPVNTTVLAPTPPLAITSSTTVSDDKKLSTSVRQEPTVKPQPIIQARTSEKKEPEPIQSTSVEVAKESREMVVPIATSKANLPTAREPLPPKFPTPQSSQLITSSKSSTPGGKVIKWP